MLFGAVWNSRPHIKLLGHLELSYFCVFLVLGAPSVNIVITKKHRKARKAHKSIEFRRGGGMREGPTLKIEKAPKKTKSTKKHEF